MTRWIRAVPSIFNRYLKAASAYTVAQSVGVMAGCFAIAILVMGIKAGFSVNNTADVKPEFKVTEFSINKARRDLQRQLTQGITTVSLRLENAFNQLLARQTKMTLQDQTPTQVFVNATLNTLSETQFFIPSSEGHAIRVSGNQNHTPLPAETETTPLTEGDLQLLILSHSI